ncbi:MAG: hypothetical protein H3C34_21875, partial [Caldilineaceae bacterium]|nr:hypothetical protein [Caldilineaceae bacterium]
MTHLAGFVGHKGDGRPEQLLADMVAALKEESWLTVDSHVDGDMALGRVSLGVINRTPQPIWNADRTICLMMVGEIYDWQDTKHLLGANVSVPDPTENAQLLLEFYCAYGEEFVHQINGTFAAAIWHPRERRLLLVSDHLGSYPLYYNQGGPILTFASGARAVVQAPWVPRKVDLTTLADLISFENVYADRTLFEHVRLLPPGSILTFQNGVMEIKRYCEYQFPEYYEHHPEEYYVERWIECLRKAIKRQSRGPGPLAVLLTGGMDSRTLIAMMDRTNVPVLSMTFGIPNCDDLKLAREVAHTLHVPHHFFPLAPDYLIREGELGARLSDGMKSCVHMNVLGPIREMTNYSRVLFKGYLGGTIHGYVVYQDRLAPFDEDESFRIIFTDRNKIFPVSQHEQLFTEPAYRQVKGVPAETLRAALNRSRSKWLVDKDSHVDIYEEDRRFTHLGVELARSQAVIRTPLMDKEVLSFAFSVPPSYRANKHYYLLAFRTAFPDLAKIPYAATGYPVRPCFRDLWLRFNDQVRWKLQSMGMKWVPSRQHRPY